MIWKCKGQWVRCPYPDNVFRYSSHVKIRCKRGPDTFFLPVYGMSRHWVWKQAMKCNALLLFVNFCSLYLCPPVRWSSVTDLWKRFTFGLTARWICPQAAECGRCCVSWRPRCALCDWVTPGEGYMSNFHFFCSNHSLCKIHKNTDSFSDLYSRSLGLRKVFS